jgi:hypothetical protein
MMLRRATCEHESVLVGPQRRGSGVGEEGAPKSKTARRFGIDRATVKRCYRKRLDECATPEPRKAPGRAPGPGEGVMRLLEPDLEQRPWATHPLGGPSSCLPSAQWR